MGHGSSTEELNILLLCKKMGWTYTEYEEQPYWFVASLENILNEEIKMKNKEYKKLKK